MTIKSRIAGIDTSTPLQAQLQSKERLPERIIGNSQLQYKLKTAITQRLLRRTTCACRREESKMILALSMRTIRRARQQTVKHQYGEAGERLLMNLSLCWARTMCDLEGIVPSRRKAKEQPRSGPEFIVRCAKFIAPTQGLDSRVLSILSLVLC